LLDTARDALHGVAELPTEILRNAFQLPSIGAERALPVAD